MTTPKRDVRPEMVRRFEQWLREHGIEPAYDLETGQFMVDKAQIEDAIRRVRLEG